MNDFQFFNRLFPGTTRVANAFEQVFLFAETAGDGGLRNAVKVFWSLKQLILTHSAPGITPVTACGPTEADTDMNRSLVYSPASRAKPKAADGAVITGNEVVGLPNCMFPELPIYSYYGFYDGVNTAMLGEIVLVHIVGGFRYAVTIPMVEGVGFRGSASAGVYPDYAFYTFESENSPDTSVIPILPPELEPLTDASPTKIGLFAGSNRTPQITLGFEFWNFQANG